MSRRLAVIALAAALFPAVTGPPAPQVVASGHASGSNADLQVSGTANSPARIMLIETATPRQNAIVSWDLTCAETSGSVGQSNRDTVVPLPAYQQLHIPAPSSFCVVGSAVQLTKGGSLTVKIVEITR
jgi:hypothetical protein